MPSPCEFLDQKQLARRWGVSPRSVERWRYRGVGPRWTRIEGRIRYRLIDVETYEEARLSSGVGQP
jgi:hypothetical protein